jgi:hypothetical protein
MNSLARHSLSMRPDIPITDESIRLAREHQESERAKVTRLTGLRFDANGKPILPKKAEQ